MNYPLDARGWIYENPSMSEPTQVQPTIAPETTDDRADRAAAIEEAPRYNHILRDEEGNSAVFNHEWLFVGVYGNGGKLISRDALNSTIPVWDSGTKPPLT
jgi:hypothetical protein